MWSGFIFFGRSVRPFPSGDPVIALGAAVFATAPCVGFLAFTEWLSAGFRWPYWSHLALAVCLLLLLAFVFIRTGVPSDAGVLSDTAHLWLLFVSMCLPYAIPAALTRYLLQRNA